MTFPFRGIVVRITNHGIAIMISQASPTETFCNAQKSVRLDLSTRLASSQPCAKKSDSASVVRELQSGLQPRRLNAAAVAHRMGYNLVVAILEPTALSVRWNPWGPKQATGPYCRSRTACRNITFGYSTVHCNTAPCAPRRESN